MMHLYLSTGEVSGEQHAAALAGALRRLAPETRLTAMGSDLLAAAGAEKIVDASTLRVMGFWEVIVRLPALRRAFRAASDHLASRKPDAAVLVDYPGFHLRLAHEIRRRAPGVRVIQYIAPKLWAWNERRAAKLRRDVDLLLCILPFEQAWFAERGIRAVYVGNPVLDRLRALPSRGALRVDLGVREEERLVALFPGSRPSEVRRMLPLLRETADRLAASAAGGPLRFGLAIAPGITPETLGPIPPSWLLARDGPSLLGASDLALAKSGTTTLEAALLGVPQVVFYRSSALSAWIGRRVVTLPWFSLPNIVAGKRIVPELFQEEANPDRLAREASALLNDSAAREAQRTELLALRAQFGETPTAERAAREILGTAT